MERKTKYSIAVTTSLLLVYAICVVLPVWYGIIFSLFLITSISLLWMVYDILTDTTSLTNKTFEQYYYEDTDYPASTDHRIKPFTTLN